MSSHRLYAGRSYLGRLYEPSLFTGSEVPAVGEPGPEVNGWGMYAWATVPEVEVPVEPEVPEIPFVPAEQPIPYEIPADIFSFAPQLIPLERSEADILLTVEKTVAPVLSSQDRQQAPQLGSRRT